MSDKKYNLLKIGMLQAVLLFKRVKNRKMSPALSHFGNCQKNDFRISERPPRPSQPEGGGGVPGGRGSDESDVERSTAAAVDLHPTLKFEHDVVVDRVR